MRTDYISAVSRLPPERWPVERCHARAAGAAAAILPPGSRVKKTE